MLTIIAKVFPVIFLILLGHLLRRIGFLKQTTVDELKKIVVNLSLPALLFLAFAQTKFEAGYFVIVAMVFAVCVFMLFFGVLFRKTLRLENPYAPTLFSGFETGMMGYSVFIAVYGAANMYKLAVIDLGQVTFVFFALVSYLERLNGGSQDPKQLMSSFIKSPVILSIIFGIIAGSFGVFGLLKAFPVSDSFLEMLKHVSGLTIPVICIVIGYELRISAESFKLPLLAAIVRITILSFLAFVINSLLIDRILHLDRMFKIALYTMFLLPPPFVIPIFMKDKTEKNNQFVLNVISIHIILSLIAFLMLIVLFPI